MPEKLLPAWLGDMGRAFPLEHLATGLRSAFSFRGSTALQRKTSGYLHCGPWPASCWRSGHSSGTRWAVAELILAVGCHVAVLSPEAVCPTRLEDRRYGVTYDPVGTTQRGISCTADVCLM